MRIQSNNGRLLLALGCICGLVNAASAVESSEAVELGEVVVTATRASITHLRCASGSNGS